MAAQPKVAADTDPEVPAALLVMLANGWTADQFQRLQPESVSFHVQVGIILGVLAWGMTRGVLWLWDR